MNKLKKSNEMKTKRKNPPKKLNEIKNETNIFLEYRLGRVDFCLFYILFKKCLENLKANFLVSEVFHIKVIFNVLLTGI
jgi:hypothetical protein